MSALTSLGRLLRRAFGRRQRPAFQQLLDQALGASDRVTLSLEALERGMARPRSPGEAAH